MIASGSESQKSLEAFDDLPFRFFRARGEGDKLNWSAMLLLLPSANESEKHKVFWELRGVFNHFTWAKSWHVARWARRNRQVWAKLWKKLDISEDGYRASLRAAEMQKGNVGKTVIHRHASQAVMATENLLVVLSDMCSRTSRNSGHAHDALKRLCSAAVVDPGFMIPDTRSLCTVGKDPEGRCFHLRSCIQRSEEDRNNGTLCATLATVLGVLGASPSCQAVLELKKKLIVAVSSAFAAQAESFPDAHGEIQPIRGKKRALHISPQWFKEVAIDKIKDGKAKSAYAIGRLVHGKKRKSTYGNATTACMSRYAWNLPKTFSNEFQLNCAFDASWKSRRDMVSMVVWGPRARKAGWAPHQDKACGGKMFLPMLSPDAGADRSRWQRLDSRRRCLVLSPSCHSGTGRYGVLGASPSCHIPFYGVLGVIPELP